MTLTEIETQKIKKYVGELCRKRSPEHIKDKLRIEFKIEGQSVILYEIRPVWNDPTRHTEAPFAKIKFVRAKNEWQLFWQRSDMKWHRYQPMESAKDLHILVDEIDRDPHYCFFG
jgi:hypothetical protein